MLSTGSDGIFHLPHCDLELKWTKIAAKLYVTRVDLAVFDISIT